MLSGYKTYLRGWESTHTEEPSTEINPQRFVKTYILPTHLPKSSKIPCDVWVTNIHWILVGGWTDPVWKICASQFEPFPHDIGVQNSKHLGKTTTYMKETHPDLTRESAPLRSTWLPCGTILRSEAKNQKKAGRWGKKSIYFGKMHRFVCFCVFCFLVEYPWGMEKYWNLLSKSIVSRISIFCCLLAKNLEPWCICVTSCCWKIFFRSEIWLYELVL